MQNMVDALFLREFCKHGGGGGGETDVIKTNTTAGWNAQPGLISEKNVIYVYSEYGHRDNTDFAAIKIGDGNAYLIDLPFVVTGNITEADIDNWNSKVSVKVDTLDFENLIFY